jgi:hypothetical protein
VGQEHGQSQLTGHNVALGECCPCAIARWVSGQSTRAVSTYVAEAVDEEAVVISGPGVDGLVVVPRQHIRGLEELSIPRRAHILAALRRATRSVRDGNPRSTSRVVVMTDPPASRGHVCFQVLPNGSDHPVGFAS